MKTPPPPSATSLPTAPQDEASARSTRYLIMMAIRIVCIVLMVAVTPYGWYTWVFGAGAVLLPYVAVVSANVSANVRRTEVESPERALPAVPTEYVAPTAPPVIRLSETPQLKATQDDVS